MVTGYLYIRWWWVVKVRLKDVGRRVAGAPPLPRLPSRGRASQAKPEPIEPESPMAEIDRILDKILVSGLDSLTEEERAIMRRYSDKMKH